MSDHLLSCQSCPFTTECEDALLEHLGLDHPDVRPRSAHLGGLYEQTGLYTGPVTSWGAPHDILLPELTAAREIQALWGRICEDLHPLAGYFGPGPGEAAAPRPRPQDAYFAVGVDHHGQAGHPCGDVQLIGLAWVQAPSPTTRAYGFGLFPECRGLGHGVCVKRALIARCFAEPEVHRVEAEVLCLDPDTKVLMADDLRWCRLGDVCVGDRLVAFDEHGQPVSAMRPLHLRRPRGRLTPRRFRVATVLRARHLEAPTVRVTMENGATVVCTPNHRWLVRLRDGSSRWQETQGLRIGWALRRAVSPWPDDTSWSAGYLAGLLDGEGWMHAPLSYSAGFRIGVSQNPGIVLDEAVRLFKNHGFIVRGPHPQGRSVCQKIQLSGADQLLRVLGQLRPRRLLEKHQDIWIGKWARGSWITIQSIEPGGIGPVVDIETDTGTFLADGWFSHNSSNLWSLKVLHGIDDEMTEEGRLREAVLIEGKFYDRVFYGLLRAEWEAWQTSKRGSNSHARTATPEDMSG